MFNSSNKTTRTEVRPGKFAQEIRDSLPVLDYDLHGGNLPFVWVGTKDYPAAARLMEKWAKPGIDLEWQWTFTDGGKPPQLAFFKVWDRNKNSLQILFSLEYHQPLLDAIFTTGELIFTKFMVKKAKDFDVVVSLEDTVCLVGVDAPAAGDYWHQRAKSPDFKKSSAEWLASVKQADKLAG